MILKDIEVKEPTLQPFPKFEKTIYEAEINKTFEVPVDFDFENAYYSKRGIRTESLIVNTYCPDGVVILPTIPGLNFVFGGYSASYSIFTCGIL